ncbi:metalloprotease PmbA [Candidatus Tachikawaea gelatinosa]|uniref:PmbA protein n=1 Tax=Candidatus Tachikawaea gelatinosa TaxID=1410383 RepID=A0A090BWB3_9ENTR|nr:metalloprotease PmbA [Candidatus Tachikawaea gelatinosa]BAP58306.1 PmbA protein [Candidatus Tachikawaea gelatinosa]
MMLYNKNLETFSNKKEDINNIIKKIKCQNIDGAEISLQKIIGINVKTRYGKLENIEFHNDEILNITIYSKLRRGSASTTDLSKKSINSTLENALDIAHYSQPDTFSSMPEEELLAFKARDLDLYHPSTISVDEIINLTACAEKVALNFDKKIINTEGGNFNGYIKIKIFGNTYGMLQDYYTSYYSLSTSVVAEKNNKMEADYDYTVSRIIDDLKKPEFIGKSCAKRVLRKLSPKKISTMSTPVIFLADIATNLFRCLCAAINGKNVYQKSTFLLHSLDKQIFPEWISIEEKPHILRGIASAPFDAEGVATKKNIIVKDGILKNWLLDSYSAKKLGLKSNGHANGIYNLTITHKNNNFDQLLKKMNKGLIITELMGQGINIINGNYSKGAAGFWVDNGKIQYPVNEFTIAGNLKEMWKNIVSIGNDIENRGSIQCGSVLLSEIYVGGI